jgi:hypothetical protein
LQKCVLFCANGFEGDLSDTVFNKHKKLLFIVLSIKKSDKNTQIIKILDLPEKFKDEFN